MATVWPPDARNVASDPTFRTVSDPAPAVTGGNIAAIREIVFCFELDLANRDGFAGADGGRLFDFLLADERAVGAAEVTNVKDAVLLEELAVECG